MANFALRGLKWGYKRTKKHDMFKQSIALTYKGNESVSTWVGTLATLLICAISVFYLVTFWTRMFKYTEVSWNQNRRPTEILKDSAYFDPEEIGLEIVWELATGSPTLGSKLETETFVEYRYSDGGETERIMDCFGKYEYKHVVENYSHLKEFWTNIGSHLIQGNSRTTEDIDSVRKVSIHLTPWSYNSDPENFLCSYPDHDVEYFDETAIELKFNSSEVNLESIENPILSREKREIILFKDKYQSQYELVVTKNEVYLEDNLFPILFESSVRKFNSYSLSKLREFKTSTDATGDYVPGKISIYVVMDEHVVQYKRKVLNFFEVLGIVGGIFEILEVSVGFIVGIISYVMIKKEITKTLSIAENEFAKVKKAYASIPPSQVQWNWQWRCLNQQEEIKEQNKVFNKVEVNVNPSEMKYTFENFRDELNWIEIVYAIKELKQQVNYLLNKDEGFQRESKVKKDLGLTSNLFWRYSKNKKQTDDQIDINNGEMLQNDNSINSPTPILNRRNRLNLLNSQKIAPEKVSNRMARGSLQTPHNSMKARFMRYRVLNEP